LYNLTGFRYDGISDTTIAVTTYDSGDGEVR